ncbi:MAG: HupE/UreJ family protein [Pseudomonadota bacterium]
MQLDASKRFSACSSNALWLCACIALGITSLPALADIFRPAYFELKELDEKHFSVIWRVPLGGNRSVRARPVFPESISVDEPSDITLPANMRQEVFSIYAPTGLEGERIRFDGLLGTATDLVVRVLRRDGGVQIERLTPESAEFVVLGTPSMSDISVSYLVLGFEHILAGADHLLFVVCLILLVRNLRSLVWTITSFTVAHSVTLICAALGSLRIAGPPTEAVIALSIVFVAAEVVREAGGEPTLTSRFPWAASLLFGLLHGLGFAGALGEIGLPETAIVLALLTFNLGVELGQLAFVATLLVVFLIFRAWTPIASARTRQALAYLVGTTAAFWTIERVTAFFG